jgi:hypothetical protein
MTNVECRMSKEIRMTKFETLQSLQQTDLSFWLRHSFDIRHSCFVIFAVLICGKDEADRDFCAGF